MGTRVSYINSTLTDYNDFDLADLKTDLLVDGVVDGDALEVTEKASGANMSVNVAAGRAYIGITKNGQTYTVRLDNKTKVNLAISENNAGSSRTDIVVARIDVATEPDALSANVGLLEVVEGTAGGSAPSAPANSIKLAEITVADSASSITDSEITDTRTRYKINGADVASENINVSVGFDNVIGTAGKTTFRGDGSNLSGIGGTEDRILEGINKNAINSMEAAYEAGADDPVQYSKLTVDLFKDAEGVNETIDTINTTAHIDLNNPGYQAQSTDGAVVITENLTDTATAITEVFVSAKEVTDSGADDITVDVSLDGGSTFGVTDASLDTVIDTSALSSNGGQYQLVLKFNLDRSETAVGTWTTKTSMPGSLSTLSSMSIGGKVYAVCNANYEYDPDNNTWTTKTAPSFTSTAPSAIAINGLGYLWRGNTTGDNNVAAYDPQTDTWTAKAMYPTPSRQNKAIAGDNSTKKCYIMTGLTGVGTSDNDEYNAETDSYTTKTNVPSPARYGACGAAIGKYIHLVAGFNSGPNTWYTDNDRYDPSTNSWSAKTDMTAPGRSKATCNNPNGGDRINIVGGQNSSFAAISTHNEYCESTNSWTAKTSMPSSRYDLGSSSTNDKMYAMGGNASPQTAHYEYDAYDVDRNTLLGFAVTYK